MSKFEEFLRTPKVSHLAVVLIRGDCVYLYSAFFRSDFLQNPYFSRCDEFVIKHEMIEFDRFNEFADFCCMTATQNEQKYTK